MNNLAVLESYGDFIERFIDGYESPSTKRNYKANILKFFNVKNTWEIKMYMVQQVRVIDAKSYIKGLIDSNKSASDINIKKSALSSLWDNLIGEYEGKVIENNPWKNITIEKMLKRNLPKKNKLPKVKILTRDQIKEMFEYAKTHNYRDYLIIKFVLNCGLRRSELKEMQISEKDFFQVDVNGIIKWFLKIPEDASKGRKERMVFVPVELVRELFNYNNWESLRVSGHWINEIVLRNFKAIGIDNVTAHQLRHNKATYAAMEGATAFELQNMLGHSSANTSGNYVHLAEMFMNNAGEKGVF